MKMINKIKKYKINIVLMLVFGVLTIIFGNLLSSLTLLPAVKSLLLLLMFVSYIISAINMVYMLDLKYLGKNFIE